MRHLRALLLLAIVVGLASCQHPPRTAGGPTILISIDGFRWDYLTKFDTPNLRKLAAHGVHAARLNPSYPSRTFPNHYTLVTGLRPEHHGIVNNYFHDPVLQANFDKSNTETAWWNDGEPVWVTAEKAGLRSAVYMWPGSASEIRGRRPTEIQPFSKDPGSEERVDKVLSWFDRPAAERPRLCLLYFDLVDVKSHTYGPDGPETAAAAHEIDGAIGRLLAGLERLGLRDAANLVVVSDHGMSPISADRVVFFEDLMDISLVTIEANGPHGGVRPKPGVDVSALVASIRAKAPAQVQVYRREEMPERLHYRASERIPPIQFVMADGWCIESNVGWPVLKARFEGANHGWDPATPNMGALFIADGPAFRHAIELPSAENIDVYNLLCATLGLKPAPNDGTDTLARATLRR